jgi:hypothetical protein
MNPMVVLTEPRPAETGEPLLVTNCVPAHLAVSNCVPARFDEEDVLLVSNCVSAHAL